MDRKILMRVLMLAVSLFAIAYSKIWLEDHAANLALSREIEDSQSQM